MKILFELQIFISQIPHFISEEELMPLFLKFGDVYKFRLMVKFSGLNRGFGYLCYESDFKTVAVVNLLDDFQLNSGCRLRATLSNNECRLYMANIPMTVMDFEIEKLVKSVTNPIQVGVYIFGSLFFFF